MPDDLVSFIMDDSPSELGGFNDSAPPVEEPEPTPQTPAEPQADAPPKVEPDPPVEPEPPKEPAPEPTPQTDKYTQELSAQKAQMAAMAQTIQGLQAKQQTAQAPEDPQPPAVELPTEDDWVNSPEEAGRKLAVANETNLRFQLQQRESQQRAEQEKAQGLRAQQNTSMHQAVGIIPELANGQNPQAAAAFKHVLADQGLGLGQNPAGPMLAALIVKEAMAKAQAQNPAPPTIQDGSPIGPGTQPRAKRGAMHTAPQKPAGGQEVTLTAAQRAEARRAGVSEEAYIQAVKQLGIGRA